MSALDDWFAKNMPDAEKWLADMGAEPVTARPIVMPMGEPFNPPVPSRDGFLVPPGLNDQLAAYFGEQSSAPGDHSEPLVIHKASAIIEVSDELLMAYGIIPDTRPKPPPLPWRWRLRNKISDWRERAARHAYKIIAGEWPRDGEDDW